MLGAPLRDAEWSALPTGAKGPVVRAKIYVTSPEGTAELCADGPIMKHDESLRDDRRSMVAAVSPSLRVKPRTGPGLSQPSLGFVVPVLTQPLKAHRLFPRYVQLEPVPFRERRRTARAIMYKPKYLLGPDEH